MVAEILAVAQGCANYCVSRDRDLRRSRRRLRDSNSYPAVEIDLVRLNRHKNGRRLYNGGLEVYWLHNMPSGY